MSRTALVLTLALLASRTGSAASVWVVGGDVVSPAGGCAGIRWTAGALFHNFSDRDAQVSVIHVSNSNMPRGLPPSPAVLVPRNAAVPIRTGTSAPVWVTEYDVPPEVTTEPRMELYSVSVCPSGGLPTGAPPPLFVATTKLQMPLFTRLTPAGEPQRHLGTDLGATAVRLNIAIYNAGAAAADATITVTQPVCRRTTVSSVLVDPDTLTQFPLSVPPCGGPSMEDSFAAYTTVVVSQPSLSMVSVLANGVPPSASIAVTGGN